MTWEVFSAVLESSLAKTLNDGAGKDRHEARVRTQGTLVHNGTPAKLQIEHRGVAKAHTHLQQLLSKHTARSTRLLNRKGQGRGADPSLRVEQPTAELKEAGQSREPISKALNPSALMVDRDQDAGPSGRDLCGEGSKLILALEVTAKQDEATHPGVLKHLPFMRLDREALNIND
jgi:hypothetical protein